MNSMEFSDEMRPLADLFAKTLSPEQLKLYFQKFSNVSAKAFRAVITTCLDNCQRFPTRSEVVRVCSEQNAWNTDRDAVPAELRRPPVNFDCVCGHSFSMIAEDVDKGEGTVECTGVVYEHCNRKYPVSLLNRMRRIAVKGESVKIGNTEESL